VTVQMMAICRAASLYKTTRDSSLSKYNRQYVLDAYDGLHLKAEFHETLQASDFPLLQVPQSSRRSIRHGIDPTEDSDFELEDDFFRERSVE